MRTITVKGVGTASTSPDYIEISLDIRSNEKNYQASVSDANSRVEALQGVVEANGFVKEDLKTLSYDVSTRYENVRDEKGNYKSVFAGYECTYRMKLGFGFDSRKLSEVLTAIAQNGSIKAELSVGFTVKDPTVIKDELLRSAAENARHKAEILCSAMGAKLGELNTIEYDWTEINIYSRTAYSDNSVRFAEAVPLAAAPDFTPDDIKSSDTATFIWEIK